MKTKLVILLLILAGFTASAQSFSDLKNKRGENPFTEDRVKLYLRYTSLTGKYTEPLSGPTLNVGLRRDKANQGGLRYRFENPFLGDGIYAIVKGVQNVKNDDRVFADSEQTLTSGFLGWHSLSYNVQAKSKVLISTGLSFGDVLLGSKQVTTSQSGAKVLDPAGYYFYGGPHLMVSYLLSDKIWFDFYGQYDITFTKVADPKEDYVENPDYPMPSLMTIGADVYTTSKLFGGIRMVRMMDSGVNKNTGTRLDLSLGFVF